MGLPGNLGLPEETALSQDRRDGTLPGNLGLPEETALSQTGVMGLCLGTGAPGGDSALSQDRREDSAWKPGAPWRRQHSAGLENEVVFTK